MSSSPHNPSRTLRATLLVFSLLISPLGITCTPIASVPFAITQPGKYCLASNLSSSSSAQGIQIGISASDVELDLAGYSISCTANQNGVFTSNSVTLNRVRIKGGQIVGCNFAISLARCSACSVRAMTLHNNAAGIAVGGDGARIEGNTIRNDDANAGRPAIKLDAYGSVVQDNLVSGSLFGLDINGKDNLIRSNHFSNCGTAIRFATPATYQDNLARCAVNFSGSGLAHSVDAGGNH